MKENQNWITLLAKLLSLKPKCRLASQWTKFKICNIPSSESQAILCIEKERELSYRVNILTKAWYLLELGWPSVKMWLELECSSSKERRGWYLVNIHVFWEMTLHCKHDIFCLNFFRHAKLFSRQSTTENKQQMQTQKCNKLAQIILPWCNFVVTSELTAII